MEMGADDYITKPFSDIELLNAIDSRLKKSALAMQHFSSDDNGIKDIVAAFEGNNALENITHNRPENTYRKKQIVYQYGNHPQKLFYVKSGKVKTYISNDDGKGLTIGLYTGGDFLGYIALLEGGTYKETAEAIDDCVIAEIPVEDLETILNYNPVATK
jgi:CRP-like cAMP-binding protein